MSHRAARFAVILLVLAVLAVTVAACGDDDPYSGTWTDQGHGKVVIAKANEGWWSIDAGGTGDHIVYAAEIGGELQTESCPSRTWLSMRQDSRRPPSALSTSVRLAQLENDLAEVAHDIADEP